MEIIRQLQVKFIYSMILIEMIVFAVIILSLNLAITKHESNEAREFLVFLASNNGRCASPRRSRRYFRRRHAEPQRSAETPGGGNGTAQHEETEDFLSSLSNFFNIDQGKASNLRNYFSVRASNDGTLLEIIRDFPINYTDDEIQNFLTAVFEKDGTSGTRNGMMYYISQISEEERLVCILNRSSELQTLGKLYFCSALLYILSILVSVLISIPISKFMIRPTKIALIKQKQFIADASHELKTPIAVIGANLDVLESEIKGNKWLKYIRTENQRMGELVKDLLYLAKNDAGRIELTFSDFDFSNAVENSVLPFEVVAFESRKTLTLDIQSGIVCNGDEKSLKQIFVILVDNAIKNCEAGDIITVRALTENQKIVCKVHNTGIGIKKDELEKIFLRFYRSDFSRARRTGGYGLGLSIARAIAEYHGGSLTADSEEGKWAEFTLTLPRKK